METTRTVSLNSDEARALAKFVEQHRRCGTGIVITASPTSLGERLDVACAGLCSQQEDITDYSGW